MQYSTLIRLTDYWVLGDREFKNCKFNTVHIWYTVLHAKCVLGVLKLCYWIILNNSQVLNPIHPYFVITLYHMLDTGMLSKVANWK